MSRTSRVLATAAAALTLLTATGCSQVQEKVTAAIDGAVVAPAMGQVLAHLGIAIKGTPTCKTSTATASAAPAVTITCKVTTEAGKPGVLTATGSLDDPAKTMLKVTVAGKVVWKGSLADAKALAA